MLSYETLDTIADAYTPIILITSLLLIIWNGAKRSWKISARQFFELMAGLVIVYGLMFLDNEFKFWQSFSWDYSTHSAIALALVMFISITQHKLALYSVVSLLTYYVLMLYQQYHTIQDILSTVVVVGSFYGAVLIFNLEPFLKKKRIKPMLNHKQNLS